MNRWRIAVGSMRRPKLDAVRDAGSAIAGLFRREDTAALQHGPELTIEVAGYEVESGVGHTPSSCAELMQGARQRAQALQVKLRIDNIAADFYVGLEGGLDVVRENGMRRVFLESWAYVTDGQHGHLGCSGRIELPDALAEEVLHRGTELGIAIDHYAGAVGIRDGEGAWGILSRGLITRRDSFRLAVIAAFAPFYNPKMFSAALTTAAGAAPASAAGHG
jgi:inosine/xanthosine triphosphatase